MVNIQLKKTSSTIASILLCACLFISLVGCHQETTVEQAARRVHVEPTMTGLAGYITQSVKPGMSREQVEQALNAMAPIEVKRGSLTDVGAEFDPSACDDISLMLHPLGLQVWLIYACYDSAGKLVHLKSADPDYPPLDLVTPPKR
jgi:hypothetical protein